MQILGKTIYLVAKPTFYVHYEYGNVDESIESETTAHMLVQCKSVCYNYDCHPNIVKVIEDAIVFEQKERSQRGLPDFEFFYFLSYENRPNPNFNTIIRYGIY